MPTEGASAQIDQFTSLRNRKGLRLLSGRPPPALRATSLDGEDFLLSYAFAACGCSAAALVRASAIMRSQPTRLCMWA